MNVWLPPVKAKVYVAALATAAPAPINAIQTAAKNKVILVRPPIRFPPSAALWPAGRRLS